MLDASSSTNLICWESRDEYVWYVGDSSKHCMSTVDREQTRRFLGLAVTMFQELLLSWPGGNGVPCSGALKHSVYVFFLSNVQAVEEAFDILSTFMNVAGGLSLSSVVEMLVSLVLTVRVVTVPIIMR